MDRVFWNRQDKNNYRKLYFLKLHTMLLHFSLFSTFILFQWSRGLGKLLIFWYIV